MTHCPETKRSIKPDSEMIQKVALSEEDLKINRNNMLQNLVGESGHYTRTDGEVSAKRWKLYD